MIVRISNRGHRHYGYYGIVYKDSEIANRKQILFLMDDNSRLGLWAGWATEGEYEIIPDEENRDTLGWPPELCDSKIMTIAGDLNRIVRDGQKIKKLLKDER